MNMPKLNWNGNDFRNNQDSSGTIADNISRNGNLQQGYKHGSLTRGLVAYYPMEKGEGEVIHDGALDNLGQIKGASWNGTGQVGNNSLDFSGNDNEVITNNTEDFQANSGNISWFVWMKNGGSNERLLHMSESESSSGKPTQQLLISNNGYASAYIQDSSNTVNAVGNTDITDGKWHLVGFVWDGENNNLSIYVDGTDENVASSSISSVEPGSYLHIGAMASGSNEFSGSIDSTYLYDRKISQPEIEALANLSQPSGVERTEDGFPGQSEGGISRYKLDGDATDSWGNNNGTNNGADLTATGVYGQAADFNGTSDYIYLGNPSSLNNLEKVTLSLWVNPENDSRWVLYSNIPDATNSQQYNFELRFNDNGDLHGLFYDEAEGEGKYTNTGTGYITPNTWQHIVYTFDSSRNKVNQRAHIYRNGKEISTTTDENVGFNYNGVPTGHYIGDRGDQDNNHKTPGKIDDVRIYDKALTPLQVEKLYHKGAYRISRESTLQ